MADWKVGADRGLSLVTRDSWDGSAAKSSIFEWAGFNGDSPDPSKAKRAFLIYDSSDDKKKGSYKLPFADVVSGELKAISSGVNAASSRISQTDAPQSVLDEAQKVIDHYKGQMSKSLQNEVSDTEVFASSVRVARNTILSADELKSRARQRASDPSVFEENDPYFWGADVSNNSIDTYFTAMANSSLRNYADDGEAGIAFQNSHMTRQLGFGRSLSGKFIGGANARTSIDFFTIRDLNLNGVSTDELIKGMRSGILSDVSIGFYGGWFRCSLCNKDMFDWSAGYADMCPHIPGVEYDITDKSGKVTGREVAIAHVEDARLSEVSVVYDGACPGAAIRKAVLEIEAGRLNPEIASMLETRYRMKFPGAGRKYAGLILPEKEEDMPTDNERLIEVVIGDPPAATETPATETPAAETPATETPAEPERITGTTEPIKVERQNEELAVVDVVVNAVRDALIAAGIAPGEDPNQTLRSLASEYRRMKPLAKDGESYRAHLIEEAKAEGVRALGEKFDDETYDKLLQSATIESIRAIKDGFAEAAEKNFVSGRLTEDSEGDKPNLRIVSINRPASVYANG